MPSILLGWDYTNSGGAQIVVSGNPWSGSVFPVGGIQLGWSPQASGNCYVGLSGNILMTSGGVGANTLSGYLDGFLIGPGLSYFIPRVRFPLSGVFNIYAFCDAACSGQGRLSFDAF